MNDEQWKKACEYISDVSELSYLTQIVLMQYEDPMADPHSDQRFHVELYFSPGLRTPDQVIQMGKNKKNNKAKRLVKGKSRTEDDYESKKEKGN